MDPLHGLRAFVIAIPDAGGVTLVIGVEPPQPPPPTPFLLTLNSAGQLLPPLPVPDLRTRDDFGIVRPALTPEASERLRASFESAMSGPLNLLPPGYDMIPVPPVPAVYLPEGRRFDLTSLQPTHEHPTRRTLSATVADVCVLADARGSLGLTWDDGKGCFTRLQTSNAPSAVSELAGLNVWTDGSHLSLWECDHKIGELQAGGRVEFVDDEAFDAAIAAYYDKVFPEPPTARELSTALVKEITVDADGFGRMLMTRSRDGILCSLDVENAHGAMGLVGRQVWSEDSVLHLGPLAIGRHTGRGKVTFDAPEVIANAIDADDIPF